MASRAEYERVLVDLAAEHTDLDSLVAGLDPAVWEQLTPAEGWALRDQIGHLEYFDRAALQALTDATAFTAALSDVETLIDTHLDRARALSSNDLLTAWRAGRAALLAALGAADESARVPWYGPPMSTVSFATARLMETWAHGQDVADALEVTRLPTARLRHVAHIGVRALPFSFTVHGLDVPADPVHVALGFHRDEDWTWGPEDAANRVTGPALDFCLVVTQRRHRDDVHLDVVGPVAERWMSIAQAFAGPPGPGRAPGEFKAAR